MRPSRTASSNGTRSPRSRPTRSQTSSVRRYTVSGTLHTTALVEAVISLGYQPSVWLECPPPSCVCIRVNGTFVSMPACVIPSWRAAERAKGRRPGPPLWQPMTVPANTREKCSKAATSLHLRLVPPTRAACGGRNPSAKWDGAFRGAPVPWIGGFQFRPGQVEEVNREPAAVIEDRLPALCGFGRSWEGVSHPFARGDQVVQGT